MSESYMQNLQQNSLNKQENKNCQIDNNQLFTVQRLQDDDLNFLYTNNKSFKERSQQISKQILSKRINIIFLWIVSFLILGIIIQQIRIYSLKWYEGSQSEKIQFKLNDQSNMTAVFTTCCGRHNYLEQTLRTFAKYNTYPLKKVIIANDGKLSFSLLEALKNVEKIIIFNTNLKLGQISTIDQVYKLVDTPYVFHCEDDFITIKSGAIELDVQMLEKDSKLIQVWNNQHAQNAWGQIVPSSFQWSGFSFHPTVNRMDVYRKIDGGYTQVTKNISFGTGAGVAEYKIYQYFKKQGYYVWQTKESYFQHIGWDSRNPRKYPDQTTNS